MTNILSIDLDILLSPYIGIYNDQINNSLSCRQLWDTLKDNIDSSQFQVNQLYFNTIKQILQIQINRLDKIYIGFNHSSILNAIQDEKNNLSLPYQFNIYNIDYHHDIFYGPDQCDTIIKFNRCECGNWVGFLTRNNLINNYYWYCGIGSHFNEKTLKNHLEIFPQMTKNNFDETFDTELNVDILFISISPEWFPPERYDDIKKILSIIPKDKIIFYETKFFNTPEERDFLNVIEHPSNLTYFDFLKNKC